VCKNIALSVQDIQTGVWTDMLFQDNTHVYTGPHISLHIQTDKQTERQTGRQTDRLSRPKREASPLHPHRHGHRNLFSVTPQVRSPQMSESPSPRVSFQWNSVSDESREFPPRFGKVTHLSIPWKRESSEIEGGLIFVIVRLEMRSLVRVNHGMGQNKNSNIGVPIIIFLTSSAWPSFIHASVISPTSVHVVIRPFIKTLVHLIHGSVPPAPALVLLPSPPPTSPSPSPILSSVSHSCLGNPLRPS